MAPAIGTDKSGTGKNTLDELLERARTAHQGAHVGGSVELERAMEAGDALVAAKELVRHGQWAEWVASTGIPYSTARLYMQLARNRDRIMAAGCTSVRQAQQLLRDTEPSRPRRSSGTRSTSKDRGSDRYQEGYADGYRAGRADGVASASRARSKNPLADLPSERDLLWLVKLAHPDMHQEDKDVLKATRVLQWLNRCRGTIKQTG